MHGPTYLQLSEACGWTGSYAVNPANGEVIPIWVADYVLGSYGSGAIMAVPAHDQRDFAFANTYGLRIQQVVAAPESVAASNSGIFAGLAPAFQAG